MRLPLNVIGLVQNFNVEQLQKYGKCYDVKRWQKLHIAADKQTRCLVELHLALQC